MTDREHGYARYKLDGCRCYICGLANATYYEARERAIAYGTWHPWADAEPVRVHIRNLQECGLGTRRIAATANIDRKRITTLINGRPERGTAPLDKLRPATAAAILAVQPTLDTLGSAQIIGSTGTVRRLQALVAGGWPQTHLAAGLGMTPSNFGQTLTSDRVRVRTARAVRALYDANWRADPLEHGATQSGVTRARRYAAAHHWAPVGAWDDDTIDDPNAQPDTGEKTLRREALAEDALWLMEKSGYTRHLAAARLGVKRNTLDQALARADERSAA
ncbi:hypothetical protein [Streptomyces sp. H27-D2]|uniref:hypothetical protein n=1 Tax=Streptomyces sp. H27-D2 TaxID=3046304 RepID=UPI002DBC391D|nr:hypothetical protein [Streptomyces sp. H27-D2]MEC4016028.1 hypothetical protein [Streptomyces sp. H27-D2]